MSKTPKRPRDPNQLAKMIVDIATSESVAPPEALAKTTPVDFARSGGLRGGPARAAALAPERRREIARQAALKRWSDKPK